MTTIVAWALILGCYNTLMAQQYDFVAIGDITVDAFIELSKEDARVVVDPTTGRKQLQMNFGEKLPYENVTVVNAVGNSPNAAVSAHRLGLRSALVANLGHDRNGADCLTQLRKEGVDTDFVKVHEGKNTNYHYVLQYGPERTILIKHEEYPYVLPNFATPPRFLYFSSIGKSALQLHFDITDYLIAHPETKLAFQPGTFQIRLGKEKLKKLYEHTEIFFCNKEEAQEILGSTSSDMKELLYGMRDLGPTIPVITDGPNGAFALEGEKAWFMPMYPDPKEPISRTGAGDAFASTFTSAIILGHDVHTALSWAPINSMSVVQQVGAQAGLLTREKLLEYLNTAPDFYVPKELP
jgi:ribokinase